MPKLCREDGSRAGDWKEVDVPTAKAQLLAFLNHRKVGAESASDPLRQTRKVKLPATGSGRYRIGGGLREKVFICSTRADSPEEAVAQVVKSLYAYRVEG